MQGGYPTINIFNDAHDTMTYLSNRNGSCYQIITDYGITIKNVTPNTRSISTLLFEDILKITWEDSTNSTTQEITSTISIYTKYNSAPYSFSYVNNDDKIQLTKKNHDFYLTLVDQWQNFLKTKKNRTDTYNLLNDMIQRFELVPGGDEFLQAQSRQTENTGMKK